MPLTRREFLQRWMALYPAGLVAACGESPLPHGKLRVDAGDLPLPNPLVHVLKRTSFGITQADYDRVTSVGAAAYLEEQLNPDALDGNIELEATARWPTYPLPIAAIYYAYAATPDIASQHLAERTRFLATYSARQLYEVMVEFWTNHFSIENVTGDLPMLKMADDRLVIRPHALGLFRDLLFASARSPAMIMYLDNFSNVKDGPNQNYARELMELHTLGVDGGYTQNDVEEVARCFTGWSVDGVTREFLFVPDQHDDGEKTVLGHRIAAGGGVTDGEQVLEILLAHPSTARFIARKLVRRFVADDPPEAIVQTAAETFRISGGHIPTTLRSILQHPRFYDYADAKFQRPLDYIASAVRALAPAPGDYQGPDVALALANMGQVPHRWFPPNGYPDRADYWVSTVGLMERWNFAAGLAEFELVPPVEPHVMKLVGDSETPATLVDKLVAAIPRRPLREADRTAFIDWIGQGDAMRNLTATELKDAAMAVAGVLLSSPYFQLR